MNRPLETVMLTCPQCGNEWEGIALWVDMGHKCPACSRRAYAARLAEINGPRAYSVRTIGGACPTQAEGNTSDGRPWYFRARHGDWSLSVGNVGDKDGVGGECVASGDDPSEGFMEDAEVLAVTDKHLGGAA